MIDYERYDIEVSKRLQPVRDELAQANITVAAIPKTPGKLGIEEFESVDWLFAFLDGLPRETRDKRQPVTVSLVIRLMFDNRYVDDEDTYKAALEWAEINILSLLITWRLPGTRSDMLLDNARLFAPEAGKWFKELRFTFEDYINSVDSDLGTPPDQIPNKVKEILIKQCKDNKEVVTVNG